MNCEERGSALVVVLVLLSGLGALALAAAAAAMTALALAGHQQMAQNAFEAAESGIVNALLAAAEARRGGIGCGDDTSGCRDGTRGISNRDSRSRGTGHASGRIQHRRKRRNIHCEAFLHHGRRGFGPRRQGATRARLLLRGACLVNTRESRSPHALYGAPRGHDSGASGSRGHGRSLAAPRATCRKE